MRWLLAVLILSMLFAGTSLAQVAPLADRLSDAVGEQYLGCRTEALSLPASEFDALVQSLQTPARSARDRVVARAIVQRRSSPTAASEFDTRLAAVASNPKQLHVGVSYSPEQLLHGDRSTDDMYFEMMIKRTDLPRELRWKLVPRDVDGERIAQLSDCYEALLMAEGAPIGKVAGALFRLSKDFPGVSVAPMLAAAYKMRRNASPDDPGAAAPAVAYLKLRGDQAAKDSLDDIIAFEQGAMNQRGYSPWSDEQAETRLQTASSARAAGESRRARGFQPLSDEELRVLREAHEDAIKALGRRKLWEDLVGARQHVVNQIGG